MRAGMRVRRMRKRDRYESAFDASVPGTRSSIYDIGLALYLLERLAKERGLLDAAVTIRAGRDGARSWTAARLLEIASAALNTSVGPALRVYERLRQNEEAARLMSAAFPLDTDWREMEYALSRTLDNHAIVQRSEVTRAQRILARRVDEQSEGGGAA